MTDKLTPVEETAINAIVDYTKRTRDTAEGVTGWGGSREGAGRPATGRKMFSFYITPSEHTKLRQCLADLRRDSE